MPRTMSDIVDMNVVRELVDLAGDGDPELLLDLIDMFLADAPSKVQAIVDGASSGDAEAVERAAHSLKGSSGNLGAVLLMDVAEKLQVAGRQGDATSISSLIESLQAESDRAKLALESLRTEYSPRA